ncbi:thiol oxidoreductase, partial [Vibrio cholerae]|nr:thiol oxidoreductase [Vibrio cholerae]
MKSSLSLLLLTSALSNFALATEIKSGGETSTTKEGANAFSMPAANLPMAKRLDFSVG